LEIAPRGEKGIREKKTKKKEETLARGWASNGAGGKKPKSRISGGTKRKLKEGEKPKKKNLQNRLTKRRGRKKGVREIRLFAVTSGGSLKNAPVWVKPGELNVIQEKK